MGKRGRVKALEDRVADLEAGLAKLSACEGLPASQAALKDELARLHARFSRPDRLPPSELRKRLEELEKDHAALMRTPAQQLREWRHAGVPLATFAEALNVGPELAKHLGRCLFSGCKCRQEE